MTVQIFERVAGDTGPPIIDVLYGVVDLVPAASITTFLYRRRMPTFAIPGTTWIAATRQITVPMTAFLPTALHGDWRMKHRVLWIDTNKWTWESGRADILRVAPDPASAVPPP